MLHRIEEDQETRSNQINLTLLTNQSILHHHEGISNKYHRSSIAYSGFFCKCIHGSTKQIICSEKVTRSIIKCIQPSPSPRVGATAMQMSIFDGVKAPIQSYVDIWTPMFKSAQASGLAPDFILHW